MTQQVIETIKDCLVPPGLGVYTVNTAKERKDLLHKKLYGTLENINELWLKSMNELSKSNAPCLLGICSDTGGGILRGANWGPLFIRQKIVENESQYFDLGDIRVIPHLLLDKYLNEETINNCKKALYGSESTPHPVSPLSITEYFLDQFYESFPNKKVFALGGDHSVSYPLVKSFLKAKNKVNKNVAIIHFDAHTDLLTERLGIDICFGSWCTHILKDLKSPKNLVQIGIRSSGKDRSHWENTFDVAQYWSEEVKEIGPTQLAKKIANDLKASSVDELYVSFDIDALDSQYASATGTPEEAGLAPDEAIVILKELNQHFPITGGDLVEVAPFVNTNNSLPEPETTLMSAYSIANFLIEAMKQ